MSLTHGTSKGKQCTAPKNSLAATSPPPLPLQSPRPSLLFPPVPFSAPLPPPQRPHPPFSSPPPSPQHGSVLAPCPHSTSSRVSGNHLLHRSNDNSSNNTVSSGCGYTYVPATPMALLELLQQISKAFINCTTTAANVYGIDHCTALGSCSTRPPDITWSCRILPAPNSHLQPKPEPWLSPCI